MTDAEWKDNLAWRDTYHIFHPPEGVGWTRDTWAAWSRRVRLWLMGCLRWNLPDEEKDILEEFEIVERLADGRASHDDLPWSVGVDIGNQEILEWRRFPMRMGDILLYACKIEQSLVEAIGVALDEYIEYRKVPAAALLRDIYGNTLRAVTLDPSWVSWNNGTVRKIADGIYEEQAFDRMPVLADALEDAGCGNADILAHCRGRDPHSLGCWAVDLLLDKP